ncbi:hypothetical protein RIF29_24697 [Crotalaria pallida]|uniref:Uncharacterized protein n=1 Tax=Crotalaria pallida TaxID=3830 RepID=A0AAN9EL04_CROPI
MAKKRGRPPKQTQTGSPSTINESIVIDFYKLDEIDLDSLPPTQVEKALEVLEEIRGRLEGRVALQEGGDGAQEGARDVPNVAGAGAGEQGAACDAVGALGSALHGASGAATALALSAGGGAVGTTVEDARGAARFGAGGAAGHGPLMR